MNSANISLIILMLVCMQRLGELFLAHKNTKYLLSHCDAYEVGRKHYPLLVLLHLLWLFSIYLMIDQTTVINSVFLIIFCVLQLLRVWVIHTLGVYWTTRIIVVPNAKLVKRGPYRFFKHPNYLIVIAEVAVFPAIFSMWSIVLTFSIANAIILMIRVKIENQSLIEKSIS